MRRLFLCSLISAVSTFYTKSTSGVNLRCNKPGLLSNNEALQTTLLWQNLVTCVENLSNALPPAYTISYLPGHLLPCNGVVRTWP